MAIALLLFVLTVGVAILVAVSAEDFGLPAEAKTRARSLFLSKLDARQRHAWARRHRFEVVASSGRRYAISSYGAFNISCDDETFCVQIDERVPVYDKLLGQLLLIKADEQLFRTIANVRKRKNTWSKVS